MRGSLLLVTAVVGACGSDRWLESAQMLVDGHDETNMDCRTGPCGHDENTDLIEFDGGILLVHRTAESQILGPNSSLRVYRSDDRGAHFHLIAVIAAPSDRDIRDPCFFVIDGQLAIKAITRLAVNSTRDSNVDSQNVLLRSSDAGVTWSAPVAIGDPTWSMWRIHDDAAGVHYAAAYEDGDLAVRLYTSTDGMTWLPGATIYDVSADTPLETELVFLPSGNLLAFVRMDGTDDELLGSMGRLRTKVCTASPPYSAFDCSNELDGARLDGPIAFFYGTRLFFVAREHYLEVANRKRTALYEIKYTSETGPFDFVLHGEFPSAGDTSYAGVVPLGGARFLVSYYTTNVKDDEPWARAIFEPTDIWKATIDLSKL